jgi:hypothetical protein
MHRLLVVVAVVACNRGTSDRGAVGAERGDCRPDKTCDQGLMCLSNLCVRPPPADCQDVAETLASIDLGNYAEPEERAPVIAKYKAECERLYLTKEEGKCLEPARDKWTAAHCVPRMFASYTGATSCADVMRKLGSGAGSAMKDSCEHDAWPAELKQCLLDSDTPSGNPYDSACAAKIPPGLQQKLQERITAAMQPTPPQ